MVTNDPLLRRMRELIDELGSGVDVFFHNEAGPLAGHVMLDRLDENGLGPGEVDVILAASGVSLPLATSTMCAATARGLGYDMGLVSPNGELRVISSLEGKRVAIVAALGAELGGTTVANDVVAAGGELAGAVVFFNPADPHEDPREVNRALADSLGFPLYLAVP